MKKIKHLSAMCFLMCGLLVAPTPVIAQSATDYVVGGIATVASALFSAFKSKKKPKSASKSKKKSKKMQNTNDSTVTLTTTEDLATNASYQSTSDMEGVYSSQQTRNITIVTNHPDFSIKVKRCAASGNTIIIDLILENIGTNDVTLDLGNSQTYFTSGRAWDDQGNEYIPFYKYANDDGYHMMTGQKALIAGVPTKLSIKIEGVPVDVETIAKLLLDIRSREWGLVKDKPVTIGFIPITRQ